MSQQWVKCDCVIVCCIGFLSSMQCTNEATTKRGTNYAVVMCRLIRWHSFKYTLSACWIPVVVISCIKTKSSSQAARLVGQYWSVSLALSQLPAYTAWSTIGTGPVHCMMCLLMSQMSLVLTALTHRWMARLSWPQMVIPRWFTQLLTIVQLCRLFAAC